MIYTFPGKPILGDALQLAIATAGLPILGGILAGPRAGGIALSANSIVITTTRELTGAEQTTLANIVANHDAKSSQIAVNATIAKINWAADKISPKAWVAFWILQTNEPNLTATERANLKAIVDSTTAELLTAMRA